jgi:hypothetical protein
MKQFGTLLNTKWRALMKKEIFYLITDNQELIQKARQFWETFGVDVQVYSLHQWNEGLSNPEFAARLKIGVPSLISGTNPINGEIGKVLPFPTQASRDEAAGKRIATMNELESQAIRQAISEYKGNLTEAAKALGIGRATLYRKVKQYNIDPDQARRKRVA